eukprot:g2978.t1
MNEEDLWGIIGLGLFVLAVSIGLISASVGVVEPHNVALLYNKNTELIIGPNVWQAGRWFIGYGRTFIQYPKHMFTLEFEDYTSHSEFSRPVVARTRDGLSVQLKLNAYLKFPKDDFAALKNIYSTFADRPERGLYRMGHAAFQQTAAKYASFSYFNNRTIIAEELRSNFQERLKAYKIEVAALHLLNMELPTAFENAIQATINAEQDIIKAQYEQEATRIVADTDKEVATAQAQIDLLKAYANSNITYINALAQSKITSKKLVEQSGAYKDVMTKLTAKYPDFDTNDLLTYIWLESVFRTQAKLNVNLETPNEVTQFFQDGSV